MWLQHLKPLTYFFWVCWNCSRNFYLEVVSAWLDGALSPAAASSHSFNETNHLLWKALRESPFILMNEDKWQADQLVATMNEWMNPRFRETLPLYNIPETQWPMAIWQQYKKSSDGRAFLPTTVMPCHCSSHMPRPRSNANPPHHRG